MPLEWADGLLSKMLDGWWVTGWIVLDTPETAMTTISPAMLEIPIYPSQTILLSSSIQKFLHFFGADKEAVLNMTNFRWFSFAKVPDLKLNSSWMEFWAQVTWDCSFQTSGPQGQPHVNAGLRSVRQLSAIWLQTKRNCLVSWSARWSYICQVGFLLAFILKI